MIYPTYITYKTVYGLTNTFVIHERYAFWAEELASALRDKALLWYEIETQEERNERLGNVIQFPVKKLSVRDFMPHWVNK